MKNLIFNSKNLILGGLIVLAIVTSIGFQNCGGTLKSGTTDGLGIPSIFDPTPPRLESVPNQSMASRIRFADRDYVTNLFLEIFGPDLLATGDNKILTEIINPLATLNYSAFGSPCDLNNYFCEFPNSQAAVLPGSSIFRASFTHQICERISESDFAIMRFMVNSTLANSAEPLPALEPDQLYKVYGVFMPDKPINSEAKTALIALSMELRDLNFSLLDQWRFVIFTLCISPDWQVL